MMPSTGTRRNANAQASVSAGSRSSMMSVTMTYSHSTRYGAQIHQGKNPSQCMLTSLS